MPNTPQQEALRRLQEALNCLYHNASIPWPMASLDTIPMGQQLAARLDAGHNPRSGRPRPSQQWEAETYDRWLEYTVRDACDELEAVPGVAEWGKVYQWGRGGRTLAPNGWARTGGGGSFGIATADTLADRYDGGNLDYSPEGVQQLAATVEAFNARQAELRAALPASWQAELALRVAEKLEELTEADRKAQALQAAGAYMQTYRDTADRAKAEAAAELYAYATDHPAAQSWATVQVWLIQPLELTNPEA